MTIDINNAGEYKSLPTRGAWIEIQTLPSRSKTPLSLPTRGAWIEIAIERHQQQIDRLSLPTRGAWIEISTAFLPNT